MCDVLTVIAMDCPGEVLGKWRTGLDRAVATAQAQTQVATVGRPDRATWGLQPGQIEAHRRFLQRGGGE